jgi:predicted HAD superfamily Cof-like phosphohydrolase
MSKDWFADVLEFHDKVGVIIGWCPGEPAKDVVTLRQSLEEEEHKELLAAAAKGDLPEMADGVVDLIYVLIGRAVSYGIDLRPVWDAVHTANMAKAGGPIREDGKRLKPPGWKPPDVARIIKNQGLLRPNLPNNGYGGTT